MIFSEQIQHAIHTLEMGRVSRWLQVIALALAVVALAVIYDLSAYHGFNSVEAMDAAQVARNMAEGRGYTTDFIRPFSVFLIQKHAKSQAGEVTIANGADPARLNGSHPDLANAPLYPTVLAGLFKIFKPEWKANLQDPFWSMGGTFLRFKPEFFIAIFNQILLVGIVALTFFLARMLFDAQVTWLAALLTLGADMLWKFSISGQSTMLLLLVFLGLIWCLCRIEQTGRDTQPDVSRLFLLAFFTGLLVGLGMLTRYAFGWIIIPVVFFLTLFGGVRRPALAVTASLTFVIVVVPWVVRNLAVSGTWFGTAGYAVAENTFVFPRAELMQSIHPDMTKAYWVRPYSRKLLENLRTMFQSDLLKSGGWLLVLFFASLLAKLPNLATRRLRWFALASLLVMLVAQALGTTQLAKLTPEINSENLLVLMLPLLAILAVGGLFQLLRQMDLPSPEAALLIVVATVLICCQPLIATLLPPKISTVPFPPYNPPEIQRFAAWIQPEELIMSDMPWAVAWYGDRQCTWLTVNSGYEFTQLCYYTKRVNALYLTPLTLDSPLLSECYVGSLDSWPRFSLSMLALGKPPEKFPLIFSPYGMGAAIFLSDKVRWPIEYP